MTSTWGGRPIVTTIAGLAPRDRLRTAGSITAAEARRWRGADAWAYGFDDGTGTVSIVFSGGRPVAGMAIGVRCRIEGTAQAEPDATGLVLWNPGFELLG